MFSYKETQEVKLTGTLTRFDNDGFGIVLFDSPWKGITVGHILQGGSVPNRHSSKEWDLFAGDRVAISYFIPNGQQLEFDLGEYPDRPYASPRVLARPENPHKRTLRQRIQKFLTPS